MSRQLAMTRCLTALIVRLDALFLLLAAMSSPIALYALPARINLPLVKCLAVNVRLGTRQKTRLGPLSTLLQLCAQAASLAVTTLLISLLVTRIRLSWNAKSAAQVV